MAAEPVRLRRVAANDLQAYKALRDEVLERHPQAFTSDAATERRRRADDYLPRLGLERPEGGHFTLGAWQGAALVGAIGLERDARPKVRHIGHVIGMMVRDDVQGRGIGRALIEELVAEARGPIGIELLTLTVTEGNLSALRLYESAGFERFGVLPRALKIGPTYHAKVHMAKLL
jgi:RimJ/RimL family protein N-acetyltransferase